MLAPLIYIEKEIILGTIVKVNDFNLEGILLNYTCQPYKNTYLCNINIEDSTGCLNYRTKVGLIEIDLINYNPEKELNDILEKINIVGAKNITDYEKYRLKYIGKFI